MFIMPEEEEVVRITASAAQLWVLVALEVAAQVLTMDQIKLYQDFQILAAVAAALAEVAEVVVEEMAAAAWLYLTTPAHYQSLLVAD
jgi:hypothetical protein